MPRDIVEPTTNERGDEEHPAYGMISVTRAQVSPPGASLYGSEIRHQNVLHVRLAHGVRSRDLNHDWYRRGKEIVEFEFSEAQWAAFVSAIGTGEGVPCTIGGINQGQGYEMMPEVPYAPRLAHSVAETRDAADRMLAEVRERFEAVKAKPTKANINALESALNNTGPNVEFAAESLTRHVENTVVKARADIEAMVARHAEQLGIEAGSYTAPLALDAGENDA